jgi:indolepyruvate ferredoxin oxidoreductase
MAYKDEYEVARLYADPRFQADLEAQFEGRFRLSFHLAPPILERFRRGRRDPKWSFGPWVMTLFRLLAKLKGLRGTAFDPFGYSAERRRERADIAAYIAQIDTLIGRLTPENLALSVSIASLPLALRGYGAVKDRNRAALAAERDRLIEALDRIDAREAA